MAKPLLLTFGGTDLPFDITKVDRSKLYGWIDHEALDAKGRRCNLVTLADDGKTLIRETAQAYIDPDGKWTTKAALKPVDAEGKPVFPVQSTFNAAVPLTKKVTIDEFLSHNIKSIYQLEAAADATALMTELKAGAIFTFNFSYRGGLEPDIAFLFLGADGGLFMALGAATKLHFVGLEQVAVLTEEEAGEEEEEMDFGMM